MLLRRNRAWFGVQPVVAVIALEHVLHHERGRAAGNVLERDGGYEWLDSPPLAIPAKEHRPAYGSDGDYWSKPNRESIFAAVYELMHEANPSRYPPLL